MMFPGVDVDSLKMYAISGLLCKIKLVSLMVSNGLNSFLFLQTDERNSSL